MDRSYTISVHIANEEDIQRLTNSDVMEPEHVEDYTKALREAMPTWAHVFTTGYITMFMLGSDMKAMLDAGLSVAITPNKEA